MSPTADPAMTPLRALTVALHDYVGPEGVSPVVDAAVALERAKGVMTHLPPGAAVVTLGSLADALEAEVERSGSVELPGWSINQASNFWALIARAIIEKHRR